MSTTLSTTNKNLHSLQKKVERDTLLQLEDKPLTPDNFQTYLLQAMLSTRLSNKWLEDLDVCQSYYCLNSKVQFPSTTTIQNHITLAYTEAIKTIKKALPARPAKVSIALDAQSAPGN